MEINSIPGTSQVNTTQTEPNLPLLSLFEGPRDDYIKIGIPLYEASIKCDWNAAKAIFDDNPELIRFSITENGETALHVAASAKGPKHVEEFVKNLVVLMEENDLKLQNKKYNTALHLAAAAGNIETVKIMLDKTSALLTITGSSGMLPLYTAALFGNEDVVKFLYNKSNRLRDTCWNTKNLGWLLLKCVENDMFDVALEIVRTHPQLVAGAEDIGNIELLRSVLGVLARKPEAFPETKFSLISRTINWGKYLYLKMRVTQGPSQYDNPEVRDESGNTQPFPETKSNIFQRTIESVFAFIGLDAMESNALLFLRFIWDNTARRQRNRIDEILRGPPDSIEQDNETGADHAFRVMQLKKLIYEHVDKLDKETKNISGNVHQSLQLQNLIYEHLSRLHSETHRIIKRSLNLIKQENKLVSSKGDQALELQNLIFKHITNMHDYAHKIMTTNQTRDPAQRLQDFIFLHINKMFEESEEIIRRPAKKTHSSRILFVAAEWGNTRFVVELIRQYPDLIWKVDDNNLSIFHVAVKHRHEGIYNLLYEIGTMKDLITPNKDPRDNNMLHLVGKSAKQKRLNDVSGVVALQMQRELLWFKEVEAMIPPSYRERKNKDGLTPYALFTKEHKELVTQGEKWMKSTASQCMVAAALIATIVFAAAFTIPGGYEQTNNQTNNQSTSQHNGIPVLLSKVTFKVFVVADAISLFLSTASILIFLSILTSRYAERDFLRSLPKKLMFGLLTLFLSTMTMTIAFSVSFFVLYNNGLIWIPSTISVFGVIPVFIYLFQQYGLFSDIIRSTFGSMYLFKPKKHVLYYKNPKF